MKKKLKFRHLNEEFAIAHDRENEKYGLYNKTTRNLDIPLIYHYLDADLERSQLLTAENADGFYGYLNLKNEVVIPFQYEHATNFWNGLAYITRFTDENAYEGVINEKGALVLPMEYEKLYIQHPHHYAIVQKKGKYGIITLNEQVILPLEMDHIETFGYDQLFECTQNQKIGIYDVKSGKFIIPLELDGIEESFIVDTKPGYEYYVFIKNELQALVKHQNGSITFLTGYIYDHIDHTGMSENRVMVMMNGLWGATDVDGRPVIPCEYEWSHHMGNGKIKGKKNGKEYILDLNGAVLEII
ncbi:WG repeat-containing protein [Chryseobacterium arthrosphaerae]|uniref:WG repeat-containing protein n=1 Tax=Chryseobacterium arthrosphaerae TaxID=651561 RepID=UPI001F4B1DCA|nr:WG repeat-containing protein [Chryseobacterium arthrosphaerae]